MNPETNRFEPLHEEFDERFGKLAKEAALLRPDGTPVPKHWSIFTVGEEVVIKDYTFKVAYVGETSILFEPVGLPVIGTMETGCVGKLKG